MTVFSLLFSMFGCKRIYPQAQNKLSELQSVSISCGNSDKSHSYLFSVYSDFDKWFFDGECFTDFAQIESSASKIEITSEEIDALFEIFRQNDIIAYAENYKKPKKNDSFIADVESYGFVLVFSNGTQYITYTRQSKIEEYCYKLVEKYASPINDKVQ